LILVFPGQGPGIGVGPYSDRVQIEIETNSIAFSSTIITATEKK
jgi:hypothetical protein